MVVSPAPVSGVELRYGVANERDHYMHEIDELDHAADVLRPYFEGLPARVAIFGGEARVAYKARFHVAIECGGALTEPEIARGELTERGRPGHEKFPSAEYLIEKRRVHLTFARAAEEQLHIGRFVPRVYVQFGEDQFARVLHWDPELMQALEERGARFPEIGHVLEAALRQFAQLPPPERERLFARLERFYFRHVDDPAREAEFRDLL